ncbi:arylamine N-acetyltransferase, partial [Escherichia coli]
NFWSAQWPQSHFRHHLLMCRHLPDCVKLTLTNFHFTHYENGHSVEQRNLQDVASVYAVMQEQFGLGVEDAKHGFTVDELA